MQHKLKSYQRWLSSRWGIAVIGLAVVGVVGLTPTWASAESGSNLTFTSPLQPGGQHPAGANNELRELLEQIIDRDAIVADILGITAEEVATARENGVKLGELIEQAGLDPETVRTAVKEATTVAVQQAVTDGTITQEQADQILNPPARPEQGRAQGGDGRQGGQRPPGGRGGGNSGEPGGTIPAPGGTIPETDNSSDTTADASSAAESATDDTTSDAPPQHPGQRQRGQGNGGQRPQR